MLWLEQRKQILSADAVKGKPFERVGRKAMGPIPLRELDSQAAGGADVEENEAEKATFSFIRRIVGCSCLNDG
jgi:hypothetical protein